MLVLNVLVFFRLGVYIHDVLGCCAFFPTLLLFFLIVVDEIDVFDFCSCSWLYFGWVILPFVRLFFDAIVLLFVTGV